LAHIFGTLMNSALFNLCYSYNMNLCSIWVLKLRKSGSEVCRGSYNHFSLPSGNEEAAAVALKDSTRQKASSCSLWHVPAAVHRREGCSPQLPGTRRRSAARSEPGCRRGGHAAGRGSPRCRTNPASLLASDSLPL